MRVSTSLALVALASNALAASIHHRHAHAQYHAKRDNNINEALAGATPIKHTSAAPAATSSAAAAASPAASPASSSSKSSGSSSSSSSSVSAWFSDIESVLTKLGFSAAGSNANSNNGQAWLGSGGPYTNTFYNQASEAVILTIWGSEGSWVNAKAPLITQSIMPGESCLVSFANGFSGAWSAIHSDTQLVNGQISNTWGECTFSGSYSTVDVSREVKMDGHGMKIVTPKCTSDMNTCVFTCDSGNSCEYNYSLLNCAVGSQPGANFGTANYGSGPVDSGGCSGMGDSADLQTYFSD